MTGRPGSLRALRARGVQIRIETVDAGDPHPNTYRLTLRRGEEQHFLRAISTGGGMMEVVGVDAFEVSLFGDCFETLFGSRARGGLAQELETLVPADAILLHEAGGEQLVEVKAGEFVSEQAIAGLIGAFAIHAVKRLGPVLPVLSRKRTRPCRSRPVRRCWPTTRAGTSRSGSWPWTMKGLAAA